MLSLKPGEQESPKTMKICFVNILYSQKKERGGLGAHIEDLSFEMAKCGHEVTVITSGHEPPYTDHGVSVIPMGRVARFHHAWQLLNPIYLLQRLSYMLRMTKYVLRSNFDIVEAAEGGIEHFFLVLFANCPIVTKLHGNFRHIYANSGHLARFVERFEAFVVRRSAGVYASSLAYARCISNDYKIPLERIKILPYGIAVSMLDNPRSLNLKERYPAIANKKLIFLSVGSSPERKGARIFIEAATKIKQDNIFFILSCSDTQFFDPGAIPKNVLILPNLDKFEFYDWISQSDIIVFPSRFESFSIAVREAMLFGKAIIVSAYVPLEGIDTEYPRYLVLLQIDAALLSNAIREITNGERAFPEVGAEFHRRLRDKYDMRLVSQATVDFYKDVAVEFRSESTT